MDNFSELIKEAIAKGKILESAMRKAVPIVAKQTVESLLRTEIGATLGYGKYDPSGKNSGDSRNGTYERTLQTSFGPISVEVPRDRNGEYKPIAIPRHQRRTDLITSTVLKLYSPGMTDEEMRLAIDSIYEAHCPKSTISSIADAVTDGLQGIDEAISSSYPRAKRQRCFVHLLRNVCSKVRVADRREVAGSFMGIARQEDAESGKKALGAFAEWWKEKHPKLGIWSEKTERALTFYEFPRELRGLVYTNNRIESFNKQIKRTAKKQMQFATEEPLGARDGPSRLPGCVVPQHP